MAQEVMGSTLNAAASAHAEASPAADDAALVKACLAGHEEAWATLIQKYKRLIYSIPFRYSLTPEDAADIFQGVCLDLFTELENLRKIESLRSWIITVTVHKAYQCKKQRRNTDVEIDAMEQDQADAVGSVPPAQDLERFEKEQIVREAIGQLPARCTEMVRLLFYREPPLAYVEVARRLGLATGSIGFIRGRCLQRLQKILETMKF